MVNLTDFKIWVIFDLNGAKPIWPVTGLTRPNKPRGFNSCRVWPGVRRVMGPKIPTWPTLFPLLVLLCFFSFQIHKNFHQVGFVLCSVLFINGLQFLSKWVDSHGFHCFSVYKVVQTLINPFANNSNNFLMQFLPLLIWYLLRLCRITLDRYTQVFKLKYILHFRFSNFMVRRNQFNHARASLFLPKPHKDNTPHNQKLRYHFVGKELIKICSRIIFSLLFKTG